MNPENQNSNPSETATFSATSPEVTTDALKQAMIDKQAFADEINADTESQTPTPEAPKLIEVPESVRLALGESALDNVGATSIDQTPVRGVVTLKNFKVDPRRVPGHPSNPASQMAQAYSEHLNKQA
jgi:CRISPR/Cas system-associated protein Cas7 (RAMP superfamily)